MMSAEDKAAFLAHRCGKLSASRMRIAMSYKKDGTPTAERSALLRSLLAERITGLSMRNVVTAAMEDGILYEDEAADRWVEMTGRDLKLSRTYDHPSIENFCATPDRELDDGLVEIKVPTVETFISYKLNGIVPNEYKPQMTAQCLCSGRTWVGFIAYTPHITDESKRFFMRKFVPTEDELKTVQDEAVAFLDELDAMFSRFVEAA
jgi:hypothetical protein